MSKGNWEKEICLITIGSRIRRIVEFIRFLFRPARQRSTLNQCHCERSAAKQPMSLRADHSNQLTFRYQIPRLRIRSSFIGLLIKLLFAFGDDNCGYTVSDEVGDGTGFRHKSVDTQ